MIKIDEHKGILSISNYIITLHRINEIDKEKTREKDKSDLCTIFLTSHQFCALIIGYTTFRDTIDNAEQDYSSEDLELFDILFPPLDPVWDYFDNY
jgi:predicted transcriptional regulator